MDDDDDLAEVTRLEQLLLDPALRSDPAQVAALLHPEFLEHGASGRVWTRDAMVGALSSDPGVAGAGADFVAVELAPDVVLLTYRVLGAAGSLRSSVWVRDDEAGWRVRFHQGTRVPPGGETSLRVSHAAINTTDPSAKATRNTTTAS